MPDENELAFTAISDETQVELANRNGEDQRASQKIPRRLTALDKIVSSGAELPADISDLEELLASEIDVTDPSFVRSLQRREEPVKQKIERMRESTRQRPEWATTARNRQLGARDTVSFLWATIFVVFAPFIGMILLYFTEAHAVYLGIVSFMPNDASFASLMAIALVTFYFSIEWWSASVKHGNSASMPERGYRFTLLMVWKRLLYFFVGDKGQYQEVVKKKSNILLNMTLITLMSLIVVLGILGRLGELISAQDAVWHKAIISIVSDSNLMSFLGYFGGGFIAIALLVSTHFLVNHIYMTYVAAVGSDEVGFFDSASAQAQLDSVRVQFYQWKLMQIMKKKESLLLDSENPMPFQTIASPSIIIGQNSDEMTEEISSTNTDLPSTKTLNQNTISNSQQFQKPKIKRATN